jgi:hypothetical protein
MPLAKAMAPPMRVMPPATVVKMPNGRAGLLAKMVASFPLLTSSVRAHKGKASNISAIPQNDDGLMSRPVATGRLFCCAENRLNDDRYQCM